MPTNPEIVLPDDDETASGPAGDDQELAAERLERALERIAASAHRAAAAGHAQQAGGILDPGRTREVATRLDALIAELRTALDRD